MGTKRYSSGMLVILALVLAAWCAPAEAANVIRGPYVQNGTPTSMTLCWRTDVATNSRVNVGTVSGSLTTVTNNAASVVDHEILVTGLTANTKYYYAVGSSTGVLAGGTPSHFFMTNPAPGVNKPIRIWAIGDAGTGDANQAAVRDAYYTFTGPRHTDMWLMLGDNAYQTGTDPEYQAHVFDVYPDMLKKSACWPTRGNHEATANTAVYYGSFVMPMAGEAGGVASGSEAYYSFNYGRVHFICLDSVISSRAVGGPMLTWLASDLAANTMDWTIAYWHHPPYSKGSHDSDTTADMTEMRTNALPILEAGGVDLVLGGHSHSYERSFFIDSHYGLSSTFTNAMKVQAGDGKVGGNGPYEKTNLTPMAHNGAVYVVAGSSGKLSGVGSHAAMFSSLASLGSMVIDVNGNHLDAMFLNEAGAVLDTFRMIKGPSGLDTTNPVLVAAGGMTATRVDVAFSEPVTAVTANVVGSYTLTGPSGAVTISSAVLQSDGRTVRLTVPALTGGGNYTLVASGVKDPTNNTITASSTVTFVAPGAAGPAITTQPANATVLVGATGTFTVVAPGATNYQWKKNGVDIPAATSASYTTPAVVALDNGTQYTVVVGNGTGTTLSNIATLIVDSGGAPVTVVYQDGLSGYAGTRDTYLNAIAPNDTVSFGTSDKMNVNWGGGGATENTIGLLQFDISSIPAGATVTSAKVEVWITRTNGVDASDSLVLERVTGNWTEASTYAGGVPAVVASGVTLPTLAGIPNASPMSPELLYSMTGIETLVQGWVSAPATNKGMKLTSPTTINFRFASREHATQAIRPRMTVTYTVGGGGTPPAIVTQPANVTVTAPATATFSVVATGATSYQWLRDGTPIAGATGSSYTTGPTSVAGDNGAQFRVQVTNANGTTTSSHGTLTVTAVAGTPPVITTQPANATVTAGSTATFSVVATGATSYQWQRNGAPIAGATGSSYTTGVTSVVGDNGAQFRVLVTNADGTTTSSNATLTVNAAGGAPVTVVYQDGLSGYAGTLDTYLNAIAPNDTVSFGTSDKMNINWGGGGTTENTIALLQFDLSAIPAGATVTAAQVDVWITRTNGVDGADQLVLEKVTGNWTEASTFAGGVPAAVASGVTPPTLAGIPNASPMSPELQYTIAGMQALVQGWVSAPATNHGMKLTCATTINFRFASREHATAGIRPKLTVTYTVGGGGTPPAITTQPANATVTAPATATFSVTATGATTYQWQRNGVNIALATGSSYTTGPTSVAGDNGAQFRVLVTNANGTTTSNNATLTVLAGGGGTPPAITTQPANATVTAPATATFSVTATGATSYQWQRNGAPIAGATGSSYTTGPTSVAGDNGAQFRVLVTNANGTTTSNNATLTVLAGGGGTPPAITGQPANVTVTAPATATFTVTATGATSYQWQRNGAPIAGATGSSYTTGPTSVAGDNGAQFRVLVTNANGTTTSNNATLTVTAAGGNAITVNVTTVALSAAPGSTVPVSVTIVLTNSSGSAVTVTPSTVGGVWLSTGGPVVVPAGGTATLTVTADPAGQSGVLNGTLTLTNAPGGQTQTVPVTLTLSSPFRKRNGCDMSAAAPSGQAAVIWMSLFGVALLAGWRARRATCFRQLS